jgi:hypothetical protein
MNGPDLPLPGELFDIGAWQHRWPTGTEKAELYAGILVYSGQFDERDVVTAQRTYPGRQVILNAGGGIEIHPASEAAPRSIFETFTENVDRLRARSGSGADAQVGTPPHERRALLAE